MDDEESGAPAPARRKWVRGTAAVRAEVLRRTAAGETLVGIGKDRSMPSADTVCTWAREDETFAGELEAARRASGRAFFVGRPSGYCVETAQAVFERVAAGEALTAVCRDPSMPVAATVYRWREERPEFARALAVAFELRAEVWAERGLEMALETTPKTAFATRVALEQLRWHVGRLAPRKYGTFKATEPKAAGGAKEPGKVLHVYTKHFIMGEKNEPGRWSEEPAKHLYSMVTVDDPERGGEPLPPPQVIREPRSTWGPNATRLPAGGAVEVEDEADDDYWAKGQQGRLSDEDLC